MKFGGRAGGQTRKTSTRYKKNVCLLLKLLQYFKVMPTSVSRMQQLDIPAMKVRRTSLKQTFGGGHRYMLSQITTLLIPIPRPRAHNSNASETYYIN